MDPSKPADVAEPAGAAKPRKSLWEAVITATPVVLTVLATILAGLSNSEMTQAQYYRSLAAQHQAKAGDQWGYFQAKRIRGAGLEQTVDLLHARGNKLSEALPRDTERLYRQLLRAEKQGESLKHAIDGAAFLGDAKGSLDKAAYKFLQVVRAKANETKALQVKIARRLASSETANALLALSGTLPGSTSDSATAAAIQQARKAIGNRRPDPEVAGLLSQVHEDELREEIDKAAAAAETFDAQTKPIARVIDELGSLVDAVQTQAAAVDGLAQDLADLGADVSASEQLVRRAVAGIQQAGAVARKTADDLRADFKAARHSFKARCYEREARQNQNIAELYEVQVRVSGAASDRHRVRSKQFFYGMLTAQAGVTIASLSLALRRKSILWSLASMAGLTAVFFGGYVYLYM